MTFNSTETSRNVWLSSPAPNKTPWIVPRRSASYCGSICSGSFLPRSLRSKSSPFQSEIRRWLRIAMISEIEFVLSCPAASLLNALKRVFQLLLCGLDPRERSSQIFVSTRSTLNHRATQALGTRTTSKCTDRGVASMLQAIADPASARRAVFVDR